MKKMKNTILKTTAVLMATVFIVSVSCLDSDSIIPFYTAVGSLVWLVVFAKVNGLLGEAA